VYVDNYPMVITHARALYRSVPADGCGYLQADIRDRAQVMASAATTLDLGQPVAVLMASVPHLIPDSDDPYGLVREVLAAVAPGSYLLIVHPASDIRPDSSWSSPASWACRGGCRRTTPTRPRRRWPGAEWAGNRAAEPRLPHDRRQRGPHAGRVRA
jgi:S-adenosyl methyltransferase